MCTHDSETHTGLGAIAAAHDVLQVRNSGTLIRDTDDQKLRRARAFELEFGAACGCIPVSIPDDLRNGSGNARLFLGIEAQESGNLACTLPCNDHILLVLDGDFEKGPAHALMLCPVSDDDDRYVVAAPFKIPI